MKKPIALLHNAASAVVAVSQDLASHLRERGVRVPIIINPCGLDLDRINSAIVGVSAEKEYEGVFVGRHVKEKGIMDLIEAWRLVTDRFPEATLLMIGGCDPVNMKRLDESIARHGLEGRVKIMGVVDEDEKFALIRRSKVLLFPSYVEGWGIVPQEALACGIPVVLYDLPVYQENVKPCEAVFTVPVGDIEALAEKTKELLADGKHLEYDSVGPEFVKRFNWDDIAALEFKTIISAMTCD